MTGLGVCRVTAASNIGILGIYVKVRGCKPRLRLHEVSMAICMSEKRQGSCVCFCFGARSSEASKQNNSFKKTGGRLAMNPY